ncbi:MAG: aldehyde ferredoxin oxidoreductase [Thermoprotei archaeon]|nr:MAG: aldehyde ferredoxin oxidoreductase [Thermoprotei archaeon]
MTDFKYGGYHGRVLRVNLSNGSIDVEDLSEGLIKKFVGGKGLAAYYVSSLVDPTVDPLSPSNVIIVATGPLTGSAAPTFAAKVAFATKSPLTGIYLDSFVGGFFGARLKSAGFDAIVIYGQASEPCYLWVHEGKAELRPAKDLWGKLSKETEERIREEVNDKANTSVARIGPAGENLVKFACVNVDKGRQAARGGTGAVLGSKRLKAIAVTSSIRRLEPSRPKEFEDIVAELRDVFKTHPTTGEVLPKLGTPSLIDIANVSGVLPTMNWREGVFDEADKINAASLSKYWVDREACYGCPIGCIKVTRIPSGPYAGVEIDGPEYETLASLGSNCAVSDLEAIIYANYLCDEYGMDTITTGGVIAFAMECYDRGLLTKDELGFELRFGGPEALVKTVELIARRWGVGNILAEGVKRAAERIGRGAEQLAVHVKGLELPAWDPRGAWGQALVYAISDRGACHLSAAVLPMELFGIPHKLERFTIEEKPKYVKYTEDFIAANETLIGCEFGRFALTPAQPARLLSAMTGMELNEAGFLKLGERIINLVRAFNVKAGVRRQHDTLPPRILRESHSKGPTAGKVIGEEALKQMLDQYYDLRGWNVNTGEPTDEKLRELGLES